MEDSARDDRELIFFCPDVTDATTLKRVRQFQDHGYPVTVFGFRRERYNRDYAPSWPYVPLGGTTDGRYGQRLRALLRALPAILANRRRMRHTAIFYARNIDQLILALIARPLARSRAPIAYEVLDIPPILTGRGAQSRMLRAIERYCLKKVHVLVVSSPGFHRNYYEAIQNYGGDWFLLENKLHPSIRQAPTATPEVRVVARARRAERRWVVGYFGLIRGDDTFDLMTRLAERLRDRVVFKFRGVLTTVDERKFKVALDRHENMVYEGPYVPHQDLGRLYGDVDFAWALDLEHIDHNSRWLLPCRFYEAGFFGVPCLAVRGFEVGERVERLGIGWTFREPLEEALVRFFETLDPAEYEARRSRVAAMPESEFVAGDDIAGLCAWFGDHRKAEDGTVDAVSESCVASNDLAGHVPTVSSRTVSG
ncbi:glycosyltransferase family 4 protein [Vineibacter terrae]|uniref:Glycosyltransferase family 4 protein n=1 Tax=Vineibacter terrae TaxID=2586908 RepID=A0A5C8PMS7_9HYPH|nr:glycosyltransferase family 4 protein [Vineibacter terrae]TXL75729.1 glycosyltransferase family 4 protein [Vineibacter terrae]